MSELKPCPFCGCKAIQVSGEYRDGGYQEYTSHVKCECCGSVSQIITESLTLPAVEEIAAEAWNTRAERTCHNLSEFQDCDCFTCSNCGESYEVRRLEYDIDEYCTLDDAIKALDYDGCDCDVRYCPNCGAEVIKE